MMAQVMAQTLVVAARELLQPGSSQPVNIKALVDILEAAVSTVPPTLLEKVRSTVVGTTDALQSSSCCVNLRCIHQTLPVLLTHVFVYAGAADW